MFGAAGMLISLKIDTPGVESYAIPIVSAALFSWLLSRVLPIWVPALVVGGFGLLAAFRVRATEQRWARETELATLDAAMHDVCDGKPLGRPSNGPMVRDFWRHGADVSYWGDGGGWPREKIAAFTMCKTFTYEDVECDSFYEEGHTERGPTRICTRRSIAKVELRKTQTAEVVFTKTYRGGDPPALASYLKLSGENRTELGGAEVSGDLIDKDVSPFLAQR